MRSYSHLSEDERDQIGIWRAAGRSVGAIARALGRAKATISRELQRNALPSGGYSPLHAAGVYQLRRRREAILEREAALRSFVRDRLAEGWTPEQISGWLKAGNEPRLRAIGCETIYAFIYRAAQKAETLWRYLTRRHKRRRPRRARLRATPSRIALRSMIGRKPLKPAARLAIGRATSSSANACGPCSSCMSASHGSRSPRGSWAKPPPRPYRPCSPYSARPPLAQVHHFRQRHRIRPAWAAQDHARYGDLVLRRLCLMAKRRHRKRQWTLTSMAAASPGYRPNVRRGNPGDRPLANLTTSRRANASASRRHCRPCSPSLARTFKSASLNPVALGSGIQGRTEVEQYGEIKPG